MVRNMSESHLLNWALIKIYQVLFPVIFCSWLILYWYSWESLGRVYLKPRSTRWAINHGCFIVCMPSEIFSMFNSTVPGPWLCSDTGVFISKLWLFWLGQWWLTCRWWNGLIYFQTNRIYVHCCEPSAKVPMLLDRGTPQFLRVRRKEALL